MVVCFTRHGKANDNSTQGMINMPNFNEFKRRCLAYHSHQPAASGHVSPSQLFAQCNTTIYAHASHMQPQSPPSTADIALRIKEVCADSISWRYIYDQVEDSVQHQHGGYGVSKPVIFHYVSNMIIALLVYRRHDKTLSSEILMRLLSKLDLHQPLLRAGLEMLAEESLRRCYVPHTYTELAG